MLVATSLGSVGFLGYQNYQLERQLKEVLDIIDQKNSRPSYASPDNPAPTQMPASTTDPNETSQPQATPTTEVVEVEPTSDPYADWLTYQNAAHGFKVRYPDNYQALDDENNLYGWPNAVVLLHGGGQAYDIAIQVWDSEEEYEEQMRSGANYIVKQVGDKYITLLNNTDEDTNQEIINSFEQL